MSLPSINSSKDCTSVTAKESPVGFLKDIHGTCVPCQTWIRWSLQITVPQSQHHWQFGLNDFLLFCVLQAVSHTPASTQLPASTIPKLSEPKMSQDVANCPLGGGGVGDKTVPVQNHCSRCKYYCTGQSEGRAACLKWNLNLPCWVDLHKIQNK